jgi:Fe-S cluster assembly protein SufD
MMSAENTFLQNCFNPGTNKNSVPWLVNLQARQAESFLQRGLPTRREEWWKYTDMSFLGKQLFIPAVKKTAVDVLAIVGKQRLPVSSITVVLVNGYFNAELSDLTQVPHDVTLCSFKDALKNHGDKLRDCMTQESQRNVFLSLNTAMTQDGVFLWIPKNTSVPVPIHFLYINAPDINAMVNPRNMIWLESGAKVSVLEEYIGVEANNYLLNVVTELTLEANSHLQYHKIQNESRAATHLAQLLVTQKQDSCLHLHALAVGSKLAREDVMIQLQERGAQCSASGFYSLNAYNQHMDNHIQIDHAATHGASNILYKGILSKKSKAVFNGKIYVHKDAQKTQSLQYNHNLLLSPDAEINTKPELEIYADDVKCAHGDTVGQLNDAALFYLLARGIEKADAIKMLTEAFAGDVLNKISCSVLREKMRLLIEENNQ